MPLCDRSTGQSFCRSNDLCNFDVRSFPQQWTFIPAKIRSALCRQERKSLPLFDQLVGAGEQGSGASRPSAFAVLRLITSSNLVGAWTASSPGLAPRIMQST